MARKRNGPHYQWEPLRQWISTNLGRDITRPHDLAALFPNDSYQTVYKWQTRDIGYKTAERIATHFGANPADIWPDWENPLRTCTTPGCTRDHYAKALCYQCWQFDYKHGAPPTSHIRPSRIRLPYADLHQYLQDRYGKRDVRAYAKVCKVEPSTFDMWVRRGQIPLYEADRVAINLGTFPSLIWDQFYADILTPELLEQAA